MKRLFINLVLVLVTFMAKGQSCPDNNHPHIIDLGLPSGTKWACCNVDTDNPEKQSPTNYGGYYAWGETETKSEYDWSNYIHSKGSMEICYDIGSDIAGTENDVAHVHWGGSWVMPSQGQIQELVNKCSYTWITKNGVEGGQFTGPSGGTIFLPAANSSWYGNFARTVLIDNGGLNGEADEISSIGGYYWTSTQDLANLVSASYLLVGSGSAYYDIYTMRYGGLTVRPVISGSGSNSIVHSTSSTDDNSQAVYNIYGIKKTGAQANLSIQHPNIYIVDGKKMVIK